MRKVLHKVKSQWVVLGVLGATVVSLGTADVRQVSASEIEGASASETLAARELGTADVSVEAAEKAAHIGLDHAISTATTDGTATVFVHWNEDETITVTVKDLNGSVLYSDLLVDSEGENTIKVLTANQDYYTIKIAVKAAATEQTTTATEPIELAVPEVLAEVEAPEEVAAEENDYAKIVSTTEVDYPAVIARATDAINTAPWGVEGYQTLASSADYAGKTVDVTKEQVTDYGVTWALVSLNGKELGWIAKDALTVQTYAAITSETIVDYPATISRGTDAINLAPWGTRGYQTISSSATYVGKTVNVIKEQTTDYGVTWAQISLNGEVLGWIAKDALTAQTYAAVVSETEVDYPATVNRDSDAINTAPWGVKGYQTLSSSADYVGQTVEVKKEQVTDYGVTWAQISLNGEVLGWIAKDALKIQTYAQIMKETEVDYPATVNRDSDAINTAPWGAKGYRTLSSSAAYVGQTVEVTKEQITDYGVTWALVSQNGKELGWIAKDALKVQTYAQITKETAVSYDAIVNRDSDAINTAPWGVKGYQTLSSSAAFVGQTVEVTKEQVTDYGVTWALVSQNGKELGWIAKDALKVQTYAQITKETAVNYDAIVSRDSDAINTAPWGVKGYQTLSSSAAYAGQTVEVTKEQTTDYGVTWALVSQNGKELGWIAKDALKVQTYAQIVSENEVAYPALINRGTDAINTAPWGTKGYQTNASSADYLGKTVEVTKEQVTDYGVTWSLVSLNGKELGWIAKDALTVLERTVETVVAKENTVAYQTVTEEDNTIPTGESQVAQAGADGYDTVTYDVTYVNGVETNRVEVSRTTTAPVNEIIKVGTQVTEVKSETTTENEVDFTTVEEEDNTIPTGERVVVQTGVNGYDTVTYDVTFVNGVETNRVEADRTTTAPVKEVVKVGTQVTEVKSETKVEKEIAYATVEESDNTIPTGERVVVKAGVKGYDTVRYDVTYVNGIETNRVEISRATTAPVSEIVKVGTQVTEVKSETTTENEVAFTTVEEFDNTIPTGERVVAKAGVKGYDTVSYDVTYVNGIETNRVEVSRTTTAAVTEIVKVGTQVTEVKAETTLENEVAFTTVEEGDNTIPTGERILVQTGVKGYDTVSYDVTYVNGVETNRVEVSRTTTAPVAEIVKVGTQVTEVKAETTTENEVAFTTVEEEDNTIPTGERVVVQAGVNGYDTVSYDVTYVNSIETNRVEVSRTTTAPVVEIVKVGTQVTEVKSETTTENEVGFATIEEEDNTIPTGERVVVQTGVDGYDTLTYSVTYVNGIETNRVESNRTTTAPLPEVIRVGTQVTETKTENTKENVLAYSTEEYEDSSFPAGGKIVTQLGSDGYDTVTYAITYVNGIETNRVEMSRTTTAPRNKIVYLGTGSITTGADIKTPMVDLTTLKVSDTAIVAGESVTISVKVTDDVGVNFVNLWYDSPITGKSERLGMYRNSVTGMYEATMYVGNSMESGEWQLDYIYAADTSSNAAVIYDAAKNSYLSNKADLSAGNFTVAGTTGADINAPVVDLTTLKVSDTAIVAGESVTISVKVTDDVGINFVNLWYDSPITGKSERLGMYRNSATGMYEATMYVGNSIESGEWQLDYIYAADTSSNAAVIYDAAKNSYMSNKADLSAGNFTVAGTTGADINAPVVDLTTLKVSDTAIVAGESVTISVKVTDDVGINFVNLWYDSPITGKSERLGMYRNSATGMYEATMYVGNSIESGEWQLDYIYAADTSSNSEVIYDAAKNSYMSNKADLSAGNFTVNATLIGTVTTETIGLPNAIPFEIIYQDDPNLIVGETKVIQSGVFGNETQYFTVTYTDGTETSRVWSHSELVSAPLAEIIAVGTKQPIAQIGGFTLKDLSAESNPTDGNRTVTIQLSGVTATLKNAYFNYMLPTGNYGQEKFINIGADVYEVDIPTSFWGPGLYQADSIVLVDSNGGSWVIMPEGNGSGYNYTSADLSAGNFEVFPAYYYEPTFETRPFETIKQDDPNLLIGETKVIKTGRDGIWAYDYMATYIDGVETSRELIGSYEVDATIDEIIAVGTKQPIAQIGGFTLKDLSVKSDAIGDGKTVTMRVSGTSASVQSAYLNYKLPRGSYGQEQFVFTGIDMYEASIPTFVWGTGIYQIDSIVLVDANGNSWVIMSAGNGDGYDYTSADLSDGNFEVI